MSGIYIHIPFCKQACHYCDFHFSTTLKHKTELVSALISELVLRKTEFENTTVETIYLGGGTPSLLSVSELKLIIDAVYNNYKVSESPEITLEANPDDLIALNSKSIFEDYKNIGINRLSIGIQSFFEKDLKLMNRAHNAEEAKTCLEIATQYFDNITLDLIYGIPETTHAEWLQNIEIAIGFGINHISSYALTVEPKTALANFIKKGIIANVDDDLTQQQFDILVKTLQANGFVHYELSNFGKPDYFSKHNTSYWQGKPYLGIGPSAHGYNGNSRSWNISNNAKYIKAIQNGELPQTVEVLSKTDAYNEYIMTGLRTIWGVSLVKIKNDFGDTYVSYLNSQIQKYINKELLYIENDFLKITPKGKFLSDGIASDLFKV